MLGRAPTSPGGGGRGGGGGEGRGGGTGREEKEGEKEEEEERRQEEAEVEGQERPQYSVPDVVTSMMREPPMEDDVLPTMFTMLGDHGTDLGVGSGALPRRPVLEDAVLEAGLKNLSFVAPNDSEARRETHDLGVDDKVSCVAVLKFLEPTG